MSTSASSLLALLGTLAIASLFLQKQAAVEAAGVMAPRFEVDPFWPKPLPNHWILGQTIGVSVDAQDHIWIIHRAGSLEPGEVHATTNPPIAQCCAPAPPVSGVRSGRQSDRRLGRTGTGLRLAGLEPRHHGRLQRQRLDRRQRRGHAAGCSGSRAAGQRAALLAASSPRSGRARSRMKSSRRRYLRQRRMILKFTQDGKFLMQIGKPGQSKGSNDIENLRLPAKMFVDKKDQRSLRRRRLRQPSRDRLRRRHRQVQAALGRLRQQARRREPRAIQSERAARAAVPQSGALRRAVGRSACCTSAIASTTASRCSSRTERS